MTAATLDLEQAIRRAGGGWLIDSFADREAVVTSIRERIVQVNALAQRRLGTRAPDVSEQELVAAYNRYPAKVKGFFQALGGGGSPEMLLMAWRVIQGMKIKKVDVAYNRRLDFRISVILESPYDGEDEPYESSSIHDFALFRHVGVMEVDGRPVFDGFYGLKLK